MINDTVYRNTFVYDVGRGQTLNYDSFASEPVSDFYVAHGFDRNFMLWAPITSIATPAEYWSTCHYQVATPGGACPGVVEPQGAQLIVNEFGAGAHIDVKTYGGAFISIVCGNYNRTGAGPIPRITGLKYEDLNGDGVREGNEPGLSGWTIHLYYNGSLVQTTTTGGDGSYSFSLDANAPNPPIGAGTYTVAEAPQAGWVQSHAPGPIPVGYGVGAQTFSGNDFGNYRPATLTGRKFEDMNADGSGAGDPGLMGWTIQYSGRAAGSTVTQADGSYAVNGLPPGVYTVSELPQDGWTQSLPGGSGSYTVTLSSGEVHGALDFGNWRPATIEGRKFDDHGADGSGSADPGLPDWTITLSNGATTTTQGDGSYGFSGLRPGTYTLGEQQQSDWRQTAPPGGTSTVTVVSGQTLSSVDFGNICLGVIQVNVPDGSSVHVDEVSIPGILGNDPPLPRSGTGTTSFTGLLPGSYRVTIVLPDGIFTTDPDLTALNGGFAVVKTVTVAECGTTTIAPPIVISEPGKITGGVRILVPGGDATSGFEFMQTKDGPRGTLEYNDHASGVRIHTSDITGIYASDTEAYIFGNVVLDGTTYAFRLHLIDLGEPGTSDHFELMVANGYTAGFNETINDGNVQMH